jgi:acetyltransferase
MRPEDEPLIVEMHAGHSERTIRMRYFSLIKRLSRDRLIRFCHLDYDRDMALVAVHRDSAGRPHIVGVSRYSLHPETGSAEFAAIVTDVWQSKSIGWNLMGRLIDVARLNGIKKLVGPILRENDTMLQLVQELGFTIEPTEDSTIVQAVLNLAEGE